MESLALLAMALTMVEARKNCSNDTASVCKNGVFLPAWEPLTPKGIGDRVCRAAVYLICLCYFFLGISIIADRFMAAIEVITSKTKSVKVKKITGEEYVILVRIWNETVSNLTLLALGSSAPEILLSVIEICGSNFKAGQLGPGTIVGSAAFNLFVIVAICVGVVPSSEIRRIKHVTVFWVTVIWSIFAYLWLYLILAVITEGVVDWWEALLTLLFFPLTVLTAYIADRQMFGLLGHRYMGMRRSAGYSRPGTASRSKGATGTPITQNDVELTLNGKLTEEQSKDVQNFEEHRAQYIGIFKELRAKHPDAPVELLEQMAEQELLKKGPKSRAFYRIKATRKLIGAGNILNKRMHEIETEKKKTLEVIRGGSRADAFRGITVFFDPAHYTCMEDVGTVFTTVRCTRFEVDVPTVVQVDYRTEEGSAKAVSDFVPVAGTLTFYPNEDRKHIGIDIVDNDIYEEDETFSICLSNLRVARATESSGDPDVPVHLQPPFVATVMIVDNDHSGAFSFQSEKFDISESAGEIQLKVTRSRGARGNVRIPFKTIDGTAKGGEDYQSKEGILHFKDEQTEEIITIEIINDDQYEKSEDFFVVLSDPIWDSEPEKTAENEDAEAAELGRPILGSIARCKVVIKESKEFKNFVDKMIKTANTSLVVGSSSWKQQFSEAISVAGAGEDEEDADPKCFDYVMHALTLPWKLLFALVPPTDYLNGWLSFIVSIIAIGLMTAMIGDLASHFGCTINLKDAVTAISLVALGTSLPDAFASKVAAVSDEHADCSIGNVTGSNAVNVFLGIGIAWSIAAFYHTFRGEEFQVEAGSLAFSVTLFCVGAVICVIMLQFRRYYRPIRGELGGSRPWQIFTIIMFVSIWVLYVVLSSLEAYCIIPGF